MKLDYNLLLSDECLCIGRGVPGLSGEIYWVYFKCCEYNMHGFTPVYFGRHEDILIYYF